MKYTYKFERHQLEEMAWFDDVDSYKPGDKVLVYEVSDDMTGRSTWHFAKRFAESGFPGNMDPSIKCFHGWRGSYNNVSRYARGVYSIKEIIREGIYTKIVLNRTDLKKNED